MKMGTNVININQAYRDAGEMLGEAYGLFGGENDTVLIVGIKDGKIWLKSSGTKDIAQVIGLVEMLKDHILRS